MAVYKDKNGTWYVSARYTNWKGEADRKVKTVAVVIDVFFHIANLHVSFIYSSAEWL